MFPHSRPVIAGGKGEISILVRGNNGDPRHKEYVREIGGYGWVIRPYFDDGTPRLEGDVTKKTREELESLSLEEIVHQDMVDDVLKQFECQG